MFEFLGFQSDALEVFFLPGCGGVSQDNWCQSASGTAPHTRRFNVLYFIAFSMGCYSYSHRFAYARFTLKSFLSIICFIVKNKNLIIFYMFVTHFSVSVVRISRN